MISFKNMHEFLKLILIQVHVAMFLICHTSFASNNNHELITIESFYENLYRNDRGDYCEPKQYMIAIKNSFQHIDYLIKKSIILNKNNKPITTDSVEYKRKVQRITKLMNERKFLVDIKYYEKFTIRHNLQNEKVPQCKMLAFQFIAEDDNYRITIFCSFPDGYILSITDSEELDEIIKNSKYGELNYEEE